MCKYMIVYYRFHGSYENREYYYNPCFPLNYPNGDKCHDGTAAVSMNGYV